MNLPENCQNIMIDFKENGTIVSRMGFYCKPLDTFSIPPSWMVWEGALMPNGFGGIHLKPSQIIRWRNVNNEDIK